VARVLGVDARLATVGAAKVEEYVTSRKGEGASSHTVAKLTGVRLVLKHARRRKEFAADVSEVMPERFDAGSRCVAPYPRALGAGPRGEAFGRRGPLRGVRLRHHGPG
jgi:hypothetical protein